jgi:glutaredoxin
LSNPKIKFLVLQHEHETNDKNALKTEFPVKGTPQLFLKISQAGFVFDKIHQKKK